MLRTETWPESVAGEQQLGGRGVRGAGVCVASLCVWRRCVRGVTVCAGRCRQSGFSVGVSAGAQPLAPRAGSVSVLPQHQHCSPPFSQEVAWAAGGGGESDPGGE